MEKEWILNRLSNFFQLDKEELKKLSDEKDIYSAISKMTGKPRYEVKKLIHGFTYKGGITK